MPAGLVDEPVLLGRFLQDDVCVRAAHTKGADCGAAFSVRVLPGAQTIDHEERTLIELDGRMWPLVVETWGKCFVLQRQNSFDKPGDTRRGVQVADIRLDRADATKAP